MAHNVPVVYDVARPPLKQCVSIAGAGNVAERKPHQGRSPTAVFRSLARLKRAYIYNPVMCSKKCYEAPAMDGGRASSS